MDFFYIFYGEIKYNMQKKKKKLMIRFFSHKFFFDIQILMGRDLK